MKTPRRICRTPSAYAYPLLIKQLLHTPIHYAPGQEIVYRELKRFTYSELYRRIHKLARSLALLGVGPGDTVAVLDWDSHRYLECFFAIPMMGAILHTVNIRLSAEQILYTMNHAEDTFVMAHEDFLPVLEGIRDQLRTVEAYVLMRDSQDPPSTSLPIRSEYEDMLEDAGDTFDFPDFDEDTQATLFYTTGTTGDPKGVYFSHRQLVIHTLATAAALASSPRPRFRSGDVYMPITPMFHVHAWGVPYVATLLGVKQVYPGRYDYDLLLRLKEEEGVTFSHCVPTILHMLLHEPRAETMDLRGWKLNIGGSALPRGLAELAMERGLDIVVGYGMSETCPVLTVANLKPEMLDWDVDRRLDVQLKAGFPIPLVDLRVVDGEGSPLPRDGVSAGEIVVRSPWLTQGYFKAEAQSEELWRDGWLHTGDIATIDPDGYVQITDRAKDIIKTGGEWISSLELENLISQHEAVSEVAVVGVPEEKWGERPAALVVVKEEYRNRVTAEDIRGHLHRFVEAGAIHKWALPDTVSIVREIPKTSVGKMDKKRIREGFEAGTYRPGSP